MTSWPAPAIMLVTDRTRLARGARTTAEELSALEAFLAEAAGAGVDAIQVRERDLDARLLTSLVTRVVRRVSGSSTRVLVNDRADVARAAHASGVHLPSDGMPVRSARALGDGWIVGRSMHAGDEPAVWAGADYALFGTMFPTISKPGAASGGLPALRIVVKSSTVPVVAIGGIDERAAEECAAAGAAGVAGIGVFLPEGSGGNSLGIRRAVLALRDAWSRGLARRAR